MLAENQSIFRKQQVKLKVMEDRGLDVTNNMISNVMRKVLQMGYRRATTVPVQSNSERCLVLR